LAPTFSQLEELVGRLPIDDSNYWIFEKLLEQPYDLYRPIMDMLFDGTIVVEDLTIPPSADSSAVADDATAAAARMSVWNATVSSIGDRCRELIAGRRVGGAVITRDTSHLVVADDGSIGATYAPSTETAVATDSTLISPNPIEVARAGSLEQAQKAAQEGFLAATEPTME
jgi:hypothetical protein